MATKKDAKKTTRKRDTVKKAVRTIAKKVSSSGSKSSAGKKRVPSITSEEFFQKVQQKSYELFVNDGCGHGNDQWHWFAAEQEISRIYKIK